VTPFFILGLSMIAAMAKFALDNLGNSGPHGLTERLLAVLCGWDAQPVGFVVWRIGESRSSEGCETLSFSKRR
jgi:hypothetical protein